LQRLRGGAFLSVAVQPCLATLALQLNHLRLQLLQLCPHPLRLRARHLQRLVRRRQLQLRLQHLFGFAHARCTHHQRLLDALDAGRRRLRRRRLTRHRGGPHDARRLNRQAMQLRLALAHGFLQRVQIVL
jgi:hypothetical protein